MARRVRKVTSQAIHVDMMIAGVPHLRQLLNAMPQQLRTGILVPITQSLSSQGATYSRQEVRRVLPKRDRKESRWDTPTGALANAQGSKVVPISRMRRKDLVYGIFGTRMDFRATRRVAANVANRRVIGLRARVFGPVALGRVYRANGRPNLRSGAIQPHKYAHLVERGHRRGDGPVEAQPYPFHGPARERLIREMPSIVRGRWDALYPAQVAKLRRRYMRQGEIHRQVQSFQSRRSRI